MRSGLPHRPGYAVVPQLEPGAVRRAIALRGTGYPFESGRVGSVPTAGHDYPGSYGELLRVVP